MDRTDSFSKADISNNHILHTLTYSLYHIGHISSKYQANMRSWYCYVFLSYLPKDFPPCLWWLPSVNDQAVHRRSVHFCANLAYDLKRNDVSYVYLKFLLPLYKVKQETQILFSCMFSSVYWWPQDSSRDPHRLVANKRTILRPLWRQHGQISLLIEAAADSQFCYSIRAVVYVATYRDYTYLYTLS